MRSTHLPAFLGQAPRRLSMRLSVILTALTTATLIVGCGPSQTSSAYEATVEILVMPQNVAPDALKPGAPDGDFIPTHIQVIQSSHVIQRAVEQGGLKELPSMAESAASEQSVAARIRETLRVEQAGAGAIIRVRYSGPNKEDCAKVLEAVVLAYQSFLKDTHQDSSKDAAALIDMARSDLATNLDEAETKYREFRQQADSERLSGNAAQEKLKTLEAARTETELERVKLEARLEILEETKPETGSKSDTNPAAEQAHLKTELQILEKQRKKLIGMTDEAKTEVKRLAIFEMEEEQRREEINRLRQLHETVVDRLREMNLVKDYGGYVTKIVAPIEVRQR